MRPVVLYAPKIGSWGIDTHSIKSREELWLEKHGTLSLINTPIPWYPELGGYGVCKIKLGKPYSILCVYIMGVTNGIDINSYIGGVTLLSYVDGGFVIKVCFTTKDAI